MANSSIAGGYLDDRRYPLEQPGPSGCVTRMSSFIADFSRQKWLDAVVSQTFPHENQPPTAPSHRVSTLDYPLVN